MAHNRSPAAVTIAWLWAQVFERVLKSHSLVVTVVVAMQLYYIALPLPPNVKGIVTNPRTYSTEHMAENLGAYTDLALTATEMASLSGRPQVRG